LSGDHPIVDRQVWAHQVEAELRLLPTQQASAVRLVYFHHLSQNVVAAQLGVPVTEIRALIASALRRLAARCT
jgi:DNA-directed RNA polymerase specialized sigma24 family protein